MKIKKYTAIAQLLADIYEVDWKHIIGKKHDKKYYNIRLIIFNELRSMNVQDHIICEVMNRKDSTLKSWGYDIYHKMRDAEFKKMYEIIKRKGGFNVNQ